MANKYMERCSTLLINHKNANQNHNKTSPQTHQHGYDQKKKKPTNKCWQGCGERRTLTHCWWENKLEQTLWKKTWRFPKKLKTEPSYDTAILPLGIYSKKTKTLILKDICILMFTSVLFTFARV